MTDVNVLSTKRIKTLISDTESTLDQLKLELERREFLKQENEIENLEEHMKSAELSLGSIRKFLAILISDLKNSPN